MTPLRNKEPVHEGKWKTDVTIEVSKKSDFPLLFYVQMLEVNYQVKCIKTDGLTNFDPVSTVNLRVSVLGLLFNLFCHFLLTLDQVQHTPVVHPGDKGDMMHDTMGELSDEQNRLSLVSPQIYNSPKQWLDLEIYVYVRAVLCVNYSTRKLIET